MTGFECFGHSCSSHSRGLGRVVVLRDIVAARRTAEAEEAPWLRPQHQRLGISRAIDEIVAAKHHVLDMRRAFQPGLEVAHFQVQFQAILPTVVLDDRATALDPRSTLRVAAIPKGVVPHHRVAVAETIEITKHAQREGAARVAPRPSIGVSCARRTRTHYLAAHSPEL